ncbi:MAG: Gfo/Idh/MocA family oxidoreductase [Planctomycetes bacterium]|nr:Gfo/Idh/MocA family oxidoreductase [Planctomycetota bacterium]
MKKNQRTRREFLKTSAAAAAAGSVIPYLSSSRKAFANSAPNDRPRIGCIGVGSMGTGDARAHARFGDILAVCDVDSNHAARAKNHKGIGKGKADAYGDYRKVLERTDIDVVSVVTPDHWHVKIAIEALQAGKHVFCQKPLTLTLEENQLIRNACKKYSKQVFFIGTQQRSSKPHFLRAVNMVQKGLLGKITNITVGINGGPKGGPFPTSKPPAHLDWNFWLGQAPKVDYIKERCHYQFRWWYEYSGGKFTDWGAHHVDIATWALGLDETGPISVEGTATHPVLLKNGYPTEDDQFNTATSFMITCKYASGQEIIIGGKKENGVLIEGDKGRIFVNRGKVVGHPVEELADNPLPENAITELYNGKQPGDHMRNFFECVADRKQPISDVFTHHRSLTTCHLANIAIRLGRQINWDPKKEVIVGDEEAAGWIRREPRKGFEIEV